MRDLAIVTIETIDLENCNPDDPSYNQENAVEPFSNHSQSQPEMKVFDMQTVIRCQERQLQRIQKDQSKRIQEYRQLRQKLDTDTQDMQKQIDGIWTDLQKVNEKTSQVDEMQKRLSGFEDQIIQMQLNNSTEFDALGNLMAKVCSRIDNMEELRQAEREHNILHQQQTHEVQRASATIQALQASSPSWSWSSESPPRPRVTSPSPRVQCPQCSKVLVKSYLKTHLTKNFCKAASPYHAGRPFTTLHFP